MGSMADQDKAGQDSEQDDIDWEICSVDGCIGIRLAAAEGRNGASLYDVRDTRFCWVHATGSDLEQALRQLGQHGNLDARGVTFTSEQLSRVLQAAPRDEQDRPWLVDANFVRATFVSNGTAEFFAIFTGKASFDRATFRGPARFNGVFEGDATFEWATFEGRTEFQAPFKGNTSFNQAVFRHDARFGHATFRRDASFDRAEFRDVAFFNGTTFRGDVSFHRATLKDVTFHRAVVQGDAWFRHTEFQSTKQFGSMLVGRGLVLDNAVFHERVQVEVAAAALCARRARFPLGVHLRVRWAEIVLDDADLATTSIVSGEPSPFDGLNEGRWARALERLRRIQGTSRTPGRPRLMSLQRADVAGLTVAGMDLRACLFVGAHNLDKLKIQECDHAFPAGGWRRFRRHTIAEEHHWRAHHHGRAMIADWWKTARRGGRSRKVDGWYGRSERPPQWLGKVDLPTATQVAAVYRDLRKSREDAKDEPGAAYFYYGEMEMRRHATSRRAYQGDVRPGMLPAGETLILTLYWLLSGYGVRARRALVGLAAVILLTGVAFAFWGFADPDEPAVRAVDVSEEGAPVYELHDPERPAGLDELPKAIRFSAQSVVALLRGPEPDVPLTATGEWLHLALRLVGPVLFGLAILAISGRVKR